MAKMENDRMIVMVLLSIKLYTSFFKNYSTKIQP
jgi:hypothetical protein